MNQQDRETYDKIKALVASGAELSFALHYHQVTEKRWLQLCEYHEPRALDSAEYQLAIDTINTTAQSVRNLMITFIFVLTYLSLMIFSVSDKNLFQNVEISFPLINVGLKASHFFIGAPLLILVLHLNFIFNVYLLTMKLRSFRYIDSRHFLPFLLLHIQDRSHIDAQVKSIASAVVFVIACYPMVLLIYISYRFAIYQSIAITVLHIIIVFVDFFIVAYMQYRLANHENSRSRRYLYKLNAILAVIVPLYNTLRLSIIVDDCYTQVSVREDKQCKNQSRLFMDLSGKSFTFPVGTDLTVEKPTPTWLYNGSVNAEVLSEHALQDYIRRFTKGPDLSDRNLRFFSCTDCQLQKSDMRNVDLSGAELYGIDFSWSDLSKARIYGASISHSNFTNANLSEAVFFNSKLSVLSFENAKLTKALFYKVNLEAIDFSASNISGLRIFNSQVSISKTISEGPKGKIETTINGGLTFKKPIHHINLCDLNAQGSTIGEISIGHLAFTNLNKAILEALGQPITLHIANFVDLSDTTINTQSIRTLTRNITPKRYSEINVTNANFGQTKVSVLTDAMCLSLDKNNQAIPPSSENEQLQAIFTKEKWPLCRPWPKEPIPCGDEKKMDALIAKTLEQPVQYCFVGKDGLCTLNKP